MSCRCTDLTACTCCEGLQLLTPEEVYNRPGLPALVYRAGTHARFKASLLSGISTTEALSALTTRRDDDWTIALLDAWAVVLDILTFYQERIANEGYLRTAVERMSLLELARAIGYELAPGVAASTHLAFTIDGAPGSPPRVLIAKGTRAQSVPGQDELPQPFETGEEIVARAVWNELRPRLTEMQMPPAPLRRLVFAGTETELRVGDRLLAVDGPQREVFKVVAVEVETPAPTPPGPAQAEAGRTAVEILPADLHATPLSPIFLGVPAFLPEDPPGPLPFEEPHVETYVLANPSWTAGELDARLEQLGWSSEQLADYLDALPRRGPTTGLEIHALRKKASIFGHNAPRWSTLPRAWRIGTEAPYETPWDQSLHADDINRDSAREFHDPSERVIYLDQAQPEIRPDSWLVLEGGGFAEARAYRVEETTEESRADYGITGKATRVTLDSTDDLVLFEFRNTTAYGASEQLELAEIPVPEEVAGGSVELDGFALGLHPGRKVALRGERADLEGVTVSEIRELAEVVHSMETSSTRLVFERPLTYRYRRDRLKINANVVAATHGETHQEVLGSGNAALPFQRFTLRQKPLTYLPAPVPSGGVSTLELRVNGVAWRESPDLFRLGPSERKYALRRDDEGSTHILFGDGVRGARLLTGTENISATYRVGTGLAGHVEEDRIQLLATRPLGVREVTNPVPGRGGEDPESRDRARQNAPLTVKTLDRVVSLTDYEDFARAFSGVGKAAATWLWDGEKRVVHVTLAAADGTPIEEGSELLGTLRAAMDGARDSLTPLRLGPYRPRLFTLSGQIVIDPDHLGETVLAELEAALHHTFSFDARNFGESVPRSELLEVMHAVAGVVAVDIDTFHSAPRGFYEPALADRLDARPAGVSAGAFLGAELLTLAPGPLSLEVRP